MDQTKIDPELEGSEPPFILSIEPCNQPVFQHGYHLGTNEQIARHFAQQTFRQHREKGTDLYTVALMRDGKVFDVYDGRGWFSTELDDLHNTEHGINMLSDVQKAHGPINIKRRPVDEVGKDIPDNLGLRPVVAIRPKGEGYVFVIEDIHIAVEDAWKIIDADFHQQMACNRFSIKRDQTFWDAISMPENNRRMLAAAFATGYVLFW